MAGPEANTPPNSPTNRRARTGNGRPTIGLFTHGAGDPNSQAIWSGVASIAQERDANLICFPGKPLRSLREFEAQSNVLYDLAGAENVDGLVIWLAALAHRIGLDEVEAFCARYRPLPIVTVGGLVAGIPGVIVDNYHGMRDVVTHLIDVHGRSAIAFIRGPEHHQEAEERYRAYADVLAEHGIGLEHKLVVIGDFKESGGAEAVDALDARQARFDALVAASDNMAIGAMKALQARGIRIPDDVAVAGLNDEPQSRVTTPPLTTGRLRFYEQARQATEMLLALLQGERVPKQVVLPTQLLIRQSCGCPDPLIAQAAAQPALAMSRGFEAAFAARRPLILAEMALSVEALSAVLDAGPAGRVLDAFVEEMTTASPGAYLNALAEALRHSATAGEPLSGWHGVVSTLRRHMLACLQDATDLRRAENLWQQARVMIGETAQRVQAYQVLQAEQQARTLGAINQMLSATIDLAELAGVLVQALPRLGIPAFYLSMYERPESPAGWARPVVASGEKTRLELGPSGRRFPSRQLVSDGLLPRDRRYSLVAEPLYFRDDQLGLMLFEADPRQEEVYELLRGEISGALQRTLLAARNVELYNEAVRAGQVAEEGRRLAEEADRLKSRFLAAVSHELRTPLTLIVGTIEMMLRDEAKGTAELPASYRRDLRSIGTSAQHLARLIGDVLDLASSQAGELRLACKPLNLAEALQEVILLGEQMAREKGLAWRAEVAPALPLVWGDRMRLQQVALNLVSNAVKFTEQGQVMLRVEATESAVTVAVSDTGMGTPADEQQTIFDEFHQSERATERGYGGMGLGLAIGRRLIELHGGHIGVQSSGEEDAGSTFCFSLPAMEGPAAILARAESRARTVLLLTQRVGAGARLRDHLARRGFEVEEVAVEGNPDWLAQVVAAPPGAAVLDLPPEERGWELIRLLKQNPATQDVPVVFYSLLAEQDSGSFLELDYLTKPIASAELARAMERRGVSRGSCQDGRSAPRTILAVDDEPKILDLLVRIVQLHVPECRVLKARNGREAMDVMDQEPPDLVLLDLMMPEMDGFAVLEAMREREMTRDVPVIVLTARILTTPDMARLQQGVAAVLGKGLFSTAEVLTQIEATLARNKRLGSEAQRVVRQAMAYMHEHYAEPISREELARRVGMSERHLSRCFREETGVPAMAYLNRYRVRQARSLLEQGKSVTEVALAVGFSDSSYFGRVFRQEVGVVPSAYRRGAGHAE